MLNVIVNPMIWFELEQKGYWIDLKDEKLTFRNEENEPLFEIIHDRIEHGNYLLTKKNSYYIVHKIHVTCNEQSDPNLRFKIRENGRMKRMNINIDHDGNETNDLQD